MKKFELLKHLKELKNITPSKEWKEGNFVIFQKISENLPERNKNFLRRKYFLPLRELIRELPLQAAPMAVLFLIFAIGGAVMFNSAHKSLPGNFLYPIKLNIENAKLALLGNDIEKTEMSIEFAKNRVYELDVLLHSKNSLNEAKKVGLVAQGIKTSLERIKASVKANSPGNTHFRIALSLASTTQEIQETINKSKDTITDEVKSTLEEAIDSAEETGINALIKSIDSSSFGVSPLATTSPEMLEAKEILKQKILDLENEAKSVFASFEKLAAIKNIDAIDAATASDIEKLVQKLITESKASLEEEKYSKISENITLIKELLGKMENIEAKYVQAAAQMQENESAGTTPPADNTGETQKQNNPQN